MRRRLFSAAVVALLLAADAPKEPEVPELNKKVLAFARDQLGKKVGDGECATLATAALRAAGARGLSRSDGGEYIWGELVRTVTPRTNLMGEVRPGDLLQFRDVVMTGRVGRDTVESSYPHHTAIVTAVKNDGKVLEILHQNAGGAGADDEQRRKVQQATLRLSDLKQGSVKIYRPLPQAAAGG
jgi:hypothetical protein